ncbi:MAG: cation:proton antiporter [Deltaproteobacteria bacterium]|nr:cation:proton antiporter [Deltaproteobacteria bacterium]
MKDYFDFVPLLLVVLVTFLVPLLVSHVRWIRVPTMAGEIIAGIVIGENGLGWVRPNTLLNILSLLGFAYLMFLSGLEVRFDIIFANPGESIDTLRKRLSKPLYIGVMVFLATLICAFVGSLVLWEFTPQSDPWLLTLILSTTSLGLVMPVLKESKLVTSAYGQILLVSAVVADFATMLLFSFYVVLHTKGLTPEILLFLLLFGAFVTAYRFVMVARRRFPGIALFRGLAAASSHMDLRGAIAVAIAFIALAESLGVEMILGAFLGGALISVLSDKPPSDLHHRLDAIGYAFFVPIFFVMMGVRTDIGAVFESSRSMLLVPLLLFAAYFAKTVPALFFQLVYDFRRSLAAGILLSSRLSLIIAVSAIGLEMGRIGNTTNSAIVVVAIITCIVSPIMFNRILGLEEKA